MLGWSIRAGQPRVLPEAGLSLRAPHPARSGELRGFLEGFPAVDRTQRNRAGGSLLLAEHQEAGEAAEASANTTQVWKQEGVGGHWPELVRGSE